MRFIGIILIIAGLFYAIARPWFNSNFTGEELAQTVIFEKSGAEYDDRGWQVSNIFLDEKNNPARVQLNVWRLPGQFYDGNILKLLVRVAPISRDGTILSPKLNQQITIDLDNSTSSTLPSSEAKLISISSDEFEIDHTGNYKIGAVPISADNVITGNAEFEIDSNIVRIDAVVMGGVEAVGTSSPIIGAGLVLLGILILSIFRRKTSRRQHKLPEQNQHRPQNDIPQADIEPVATDDGQRQQRQTRSRQPAPQPEPVPKPVAEPTKTNVGKTIKWGRDAGKKR